MIKVRGRTQRTGTRSERSLRRLTEAPLALGVARFGGPLVVGMVLYTAFNLVDMFMISRLENGTAALAALGICDMVAAIPTILSNGITTASVALIARRAGSRDARGLRWATWQSLLFVGVLSVLFGWIGIAGSEFVIRDVMQAKGEPASLATAYLEILLGGCFSIFFLLQITSILRALGHSKTAATLLVSGNLLNIVLNVFLIYGAGPRPDVFAWAQPAAAALGIPRLGVRGAAWATLIGRTLPVLIGLWLLLKRPGGPKFRLLYLRPRWKELRALIRLGWPASAQLIVRVSAILVLISLINANYTSADDQSILTGYSICLRLETMALFIGMGWGAAAASFVGMNLGAGLRTRAKRSGWIAATYNFGLMVVFVACYVAFADAIIGFFDTDPGVVEAGRSYLRTVGLSYGFIGVAIVLSQAMAGAGATLSSLLLDAAVVTVLMVPAAVYVAEVRHLGEQALWWVIAASNLAAAVAYIAWYGRGRFLDKRL